MKRLSRGNVLLSVLIGGTLGLVAVVGVNTSTSHSLRAAHVKESFFIADNSIGTSLEALANLFNRYAIWERPRWDGTIEWLAVNDMTAVWTFHKDDGPLFAYTLCNERALAAQVPVLFGATGYPPNLHLCVDPGKTMLLSKLKFGTMKNDFAAAEYSLDLNTTTEILANQKGDKMGASVNARINMPPPLPWCDLSPTGNTIACEALQSLDMKTAASDKALAVLINDAASSLAPDLHGAVFDFNPTSLAPGTPNVRSNVKNPYCGDFSYSPAVCLRAACNSDGVCSGCAEWRPEQYTPGPPKTNTVLVRTTGYATDPPFDSHAKFDCQVTVNVLAPAFAGVAPPRPDNPPPETPKCPERGTLVLEANQGGCFPLRAYANTCKRPPPDMCLDADLYCHDGTFIRTRHCDAPYGQGCFHPDTQMLLGDGTYKRAEDIRHGDFLWNPFTQKGQRVEVVTAGPEQLPLVELGYDDIRLQVTTKHPVVTQRGVHQAVDVEAGDSMLGDDGKFHRVTHLARPQMPPGKFVYNFQLAGESRAITNHMIVAAGAITGDWMIQSYLEQGVRFGLSELALGWPTTNPIPIYSLVGKHLHGVGFVLNREKKWNE